MNLIALLIGLGIERLATQLFHLRRLRWLDRIIDGGFRQARRVANWPPVLVVVLLALLLALPVIVVTVALGDVLLGAPYLLLAVVVLFFSLGPKDIGEDVSEYCEALQSGDEERIRQTSKAIIESDVPEEPAERMLRVESAVCVQANNRLFAVIFWFILLGPVGAWSYRATDLIRRRAVFNESRDEEDDEHLIRMREAARTVHSWLAWIPARLTAIGYAIAGHFESALAAWRALPEPPPATAWEATKNLLARVGVGALALDHGDPEASAERAMRGATAANQLVFRLLIIWAVVIAAMTLYGVLV